MRDKFTDPLTGDSYEFDIGHETEEAIGKQRTTTLSANTANTGLVKQQGDVQPLVLKYKGTILKKSQIAEMWRWYELCEDQTIFFTDFAGEEYEIIITEFLPERLAQVRNPRDPENAPLWYWKYTLWMEVITVRSGLLVNVTP